MRNQDCPGVLKELVSDLISCYEIYSSNQPKLHKVMNDDERKIIADLVRSNYILNKQAYLELDHYKSNGELLGKHPIFKVIKLKDAINVLSTPRLFNKIKALETNIFRNKQKENIELVNRDEALLKHAKQVAEKR
ncbi:hypothetical protein ES692_06135 [Psychroserpens burtonensis]|uniref:Uncharacterized protein n=1 Tax=Psychroserpens burtonensis TaxID=49278 RepID=A0A5C7B8I3_9FLAO|nr:hypothetical protein [Psychroserpens burtonensis]TXE18620.1 hypothetical protein ES692_06135 [Psychroserpens burtonensis]